MPMVSQSSVGSQHLLIDAMFACQHSVSLAAVYCKDLNSGSWSRGCAVGGASTSCFSCAVQQASSCLFTGQAAHNTM